MAAIPLLPNTQARHLFLKQHGLGIRPSGPGKGADLAQVIDDLGFVQVDSINTLARAHHMILHSRRQSYRAAHLAPVISRDRQAFEHWTHDASILPMRFFPHWRHNMARHAEKLQGQWKNWRRDGFEEKFDAVLRQIADHGPCCSADVGTDEARSSGGWWDWHPSKTALEYLWRSGALSVCHRKGFRKYYDLTENVVPPEHLNARTDLEETLDWAHNAALDRLGFATASEIADFWALATKGEAKAWALDALSRGEIKEVMVEAADGSTRAALIRPEILEGAPSLPEPPGMVRILSPFDPALRDRKRAERLFGFHYRIEIFVPAAKRQYGYYVFPVLDGAHIIGRIDMACDSKTGLLAVRAFWPETGIKMGDGRKARLATAIERSARLASAKDIAYANNWLRQPAS